VLTPIESSLLSTPHAIRSRSCATRSRHHHEVGQPIVGGTDIDRLPVRREDLSETVNLGLTFAGFGAQCSLAHREVT
jgi:hypothetical protein